MVMDYGPDWPPVAERVCPICEQPRCSLSHLRDRLAPAVTVAARVMVRTYVWSIAALWFGRAAGWI